MRLLATDRIAHRFSIYLNGVEQKNAVEADDVEGYVITLVPRDDGSPIRTRWDGQVVILQVDEPELVLVNRCLECPYVRRAADSNEVSCVAGPNIRWFSQTIAHRGVDKNCVMRDKPRTLIVVR